MRIFQHFPFTGRVQQWVVPQGVTSATFECWGAGGGLSSDLAWEGAPREVRGGSAPANIYFYNGPQSQQGQLGVSYSNNAGYAGGTKAVNPGETYWVYVGGNGGPGLSTIKINWNSTIYTVALRGGTGGWNGGGAGGKGAEITQNLYNGTTPRVHYTQNGIPAAAYASQKWYDTGSHLVYQCNHTYHKGQASMSYWDKVTKLHSHAVGPSGGGGGGATDIRQGGSDVSNRILVAGGAGGAGGVWSTSGTDAWTLQPTPASPAPPFGSDTIGTGPSGPDSTWCTAIDYLAGGWGGGGLGGANGPAPQAAPTTDGGAATQGGDGGPSTAMRGDDSPATAVSGSGGGGGGALVGGGRGAGGAGASAGSAGQGGSGADADGGWDSWCAGGGGGGGGYFGGGGGGQGFKVGGKYGVTRGGGGGGGSNYASPAFTQTLLTGGVRPPVAAWNSGTGANGLGGFARISFRLPPSVQWKAVPSAVAGGADFDATFTYAPAEAGGSQISHYEVGTAAGSSASTPTSQTTVMVSDPTQTDLTWTFTAPAGGSTSSYFVRVTDTDGDTSGWLKQIVTGLNVPVTTPATISSPAAGSTFTGDTTVNWSVGTQSPLVAYRLGVAGTDIVSGVAQDFPTRWRRGGSRVNLALDPGFQTGGVWSSTSNVNLVASTDHPGISGSGGKISWTLVDDYSAENHTTVWNNLVLGATYRLHIEVASNLTNDARPVEVQVRDANGALASKSADLSVTAAGTYVPLDIEFTPHTQGVYVVVLPSATDTYGDPVVNLDFEDTTTGGFTGSVANDTTHSHTGDDALKATGTGTLDITSALTSKGDGADVYVVECWAYVPAASTSNATLSVGGAGATAITGTETTRDAWTMIRLPFHWDGTGAVTLTVNGDATGHWFDDIKVSISNSTQIGTTWANQINPMYGSTDSGQVTYLANMLLELKYEEDAAGYGTYFDGDHLNGNTGAVSWTGTANASASLLTGTDKTSGDLPYSGGPLNSGEIYLDTLSKDGALSGHTGTRATISVKVNPSHPTAASVALEVNQSLGLMTLTVTAQDSTDTYKTVSFDIFRNGVRIATGLTPDGTTRQATFIDAPGSGVAATYKVRAFDSNGGYTDQTDGTVTVVS